MRTSSPSFAHLVFVFLSSTSAWATDLIFQTPGPLDQVWARPTNSAATILGHAAEIHVGAAPVPITRIGFYGEVRKPARIRWVVYSNQTDRLPLMQSAAVDYQPTTSVQWLESPSFAPYLLNAGSTYYIGFIAKGEEGAVHFHSNAQGSGMSTTQNGLIMSTVPTARSANIYDSFESPRLMMNAQLQMGIRLRHGSGLISPRSEVLGSDIPVTFYLSGAVTPGSLQLTFIDGENRHTLTLGSQFESAGLHELSFKPHAPTSNPGIVAGEPLPDGKYTVQLSARMLNGELVSDSAEDVFIDRNAAFFTLPGGEITFTEGDQSVPIAAGATVDELRWDRGSLTVNIEANALNSDYLLLLSDARIHIAPTSARDGDTPFATLESATVQGTGTLRATFNANATNDRVQALLGALRYVNGSHNPGSATRTIRITLTDSAGLQSSVTRELRTIPVNDAPILSSNGQGVTFTEGKNVPNTPVVISPSITILDPDSPTFASATVRITNGFEFAEDLLIFSPGTAPVGNITGRYSAETGVLSLTSQGATATAAQWQTALQNVRYDNWSQNPIANSRTVEFVLDDGALPSNVVSHSVKVVPVNDRPVANAANISTNEDEAVAIKLTGSDPDSHGVITFQVRSYPQNGSLTGAAPDLVYTPAPNFHGTDSFTFQVTDGIESSAIATVTILVKNVNDPPTLAPLPGVDVLENWGSTIIVPFTGISSGAPDEVHDFIVTAKTHSDHLIPNVSVYYVSPGEGGTIAFQPAPDANGIATISVTVREAQTQASVTRSFDVYVRPVNSAPGFSKGADITVPTGAGPQTFPSWATGITAGPPDESGQAVTFVVAPDYPSLFTEPPRIDSTGRLSFTPAPKASGRTTVTVEARDNGGLANGGVDSSPLETFQITITSPAEESGAYVGLVLPELDEDRSHDRAGIIRVDVQPGGAFTGNLRLGGRAIPLKGRFDQSGIAQFGSSTSLRLPGTTPPLHLSLTLDVTEGSGKLTGEIRRNGATPALAATEPDAPFARVDADRVLYTAATPPRPPRQNVPGALLGRYTVLLENAEPPQGAAQLPEGSGYLLVTLDRRGIARCTGRLADGTAVSYANHLLADKTWPMQLLAYEGRGSTVGRLRWEENGEDVTITGDLDWFRPAIPGSRRYPQGWPAGIDIVAQGEQFTLPAPPQPPSLFADLHPVSPTGNATLEISGADFSAQEHRLNIYPATNRAVSLSVFGKSLRLQFRLNGTISGSFADPFTAVTGQISGAVLQKSGRAAGFILGPREAGAIRLTTSATATSVNTEDR